METKHCNTGDECDALARAIECVGRADTLAKALGVTPAAIYQWRSGVRPIPANRCPDIEAATEGRVRCEELRPDVRWSVLRDRRATRETAP